MGRSVSYADNSEIVEYIDVGEIEDQFIWDLYVDDLVESLKDSFPSLEEDDQWLSREDHVIASNALVYVGLSEYCGLASLWVTPRACHDEIYDNDTTGLAINWCNKISDKFHKQFGEYNRVGSFSDGTSVYEIA